MKICTRGCAFYFNVRRLTNIIVSNMSTTHIDWKKWGAHVNYTCNQFAGTKNVFLQNVPPPNIACNIDRIIQWNAMVDSFLISSRVLAAFFFTTEPSEVKPTKWIPRRWNKIKWKKYQLHEDYYMRQLVPDFTLTTKQYQALQDWHDIVSKTVAHLGVDRDTMLQNRLPEAKKIVPILELLINDVQSRIQNQGEYAWQAVIPTGYCPSDLTSS
jgi:hypothetical protein